MRINGGKRNNPSGSKNERNGDDYMKKTLIYAVLLLLVAQASFAALNDARAYYSFDDGDVRDISGNNNNATNQGTTTSVSVNVLGLSRAFDASDTQWIDLPSTTLIPTSTSTSFSISYWVRMNSTAGFVMPFSTNDANPYMRAFFQANGSLQYDLFDGVVNPSPNSGITFSTGTWYHVVHVLDRNSNSAYSYINGVLRGNSSAVGLGSMNSSIEFRLGQRNGANYITGYIDEVGVWNRALSNAEAIELYNGGVGFNPYLGTNLTYTINVNDLFDNGGLNGANVTIYNATYSTSALTSAGSVEFSFNSSQIFNYNVTLADYTSASGVVYPNGTNTSYLSQAVYNDVDIYAKITNEAITTPYNLTVQNGRTYTNYDGTTPIYLRAGQMNFTFNKNGWFNFSFQKNVTAGTNTTTSASGAYNSTLNVYARTIGNTSISSSTVFTITKLDSPNISYSETYNVTGGNYNFTIVTGEYNISVFPTGYEYKSTVINITNGTTNFYSLHYTKNSISFNFTDEITKALVTGVNISFDLISTVFSANYTTNNGTSFVDLLTPASYNIRYRAAGYAERFYSLTLVDNYHYNVELRMVNASSVTNCSIKVLDNIGNAIEGATVKILKFDVTTNSFLLNQVINTNFEGEVYASIFENTEYYEFMIDYEGENVYMTQPTYIYSCPLEFYINIEETGVEDYVTSTNLAGNITHSYTTHLSTFYWNDHYNVATQGCVYVYKYPDLTLTNYTCSSGSSGVIYVGIDNSTEASYIVKGYITSGGKNYLVASNNVNYYVESPSGALGAFLAILLLVTAVFVGFWSISIAVILGSFVPLIFTITGLWGIGLTVTAPILVGGLIIAYLLRGE